MIVETPKNNQPNKYLLSELDKYRRETNAIFYSLSRNLITLSVLSLTISPAFIGTKLQDDTARYAFIFSMTAALISIFAGIAQYYRDWKGFGEYTRYMATITYKDQKNFNDTENKLIDKFTRQNKGSRTFNTGEGWLVVQLVAILTSLSLLLVVVLKIVTVNS